MTLKRRGISSSVLVTSSPTFASRDPPQQAQVVGASTFDVMKPLNQIEQQIQIVKAAIRPASADGFLEGYANRFRTTGSSSEPARSSQLHPQPMARRTFLSRVSCTSTENADSSDAARQFVRVMHPFHPLFGRQLLCVGKRYNRYGERLLLQGDGATVWSVPPQWTDLVSPDAEIVMGHGRALLRTFDLMELASLVKRLSDGAALRSRANRKDDYAADVR
ncbi:DUF5372 family protein [Bradyrhizobium sp. USDA 4502]